MVSSKQLCGTEQPGGCRRFGKSYGTRGCHVGRSQLDLEVQVGSAAGMRGVTFWECAATICARANLSLQTQPKAQGTLG
eukprot:1159547-Pelagomonas_calceolata.AAC.3